MTPDDNNDKLLEAIETEHRNTFLFDNKRFKLGGESGYSGGIYYIGEDDELIEINYYKVLEVLHPEIQWIYESTNDYQGDWICIGKDKNDVWYYKRGSYGSCSGCDWYMGINDKEGAIEYIKSMNVIDKVGTKEELIEYLKKEKTNGWNDIKNLLDAIIKRIQ